MQGFNSTFRAPIPGSSIAHKYGSFPFSRPPQFTKANDALEYFWKLLHKKDTLKQLWYLQEHGATCFAIARALLFKAAMEGIIQMNLGVVIYPTLEKMLHALGTAKGIKVEMHPKIKDPTHETMTNDTLNELMGNKNKVQVPSSMLSKLPIPKPEDAKSQFEAKMKAKTLQSPPIAQAVVQPSQPQGIMNMGNKEQ